MTDPRITQLAEGLINFSCAMKAGEHILIELYEVPDEIGIELIRAARKAGAVPHLRLHHSRITREMYTGATDAQYEAISKVLMEEMKAMDAYISIRGGNNSFENSSVPADDMKLVMKYMRPVLDERVGNTKWCVLRWPNPAMAQSAQMSTENFEDFYFNCCLADYAALKVAMDKLGKRMMQADKVRIVGPGTDLSFSIKGMPAITCAGSNNIPDGEVFTAPIRDSVNGVLSYNTPAVYQGIGFEGIVFEFKDGKIVKASSNGNSEALNKILDSDEGARYIGEFALGVNPEIMNPMRDTLFDEKIVGSFHFTPGQAYDDCDNGNRSQIHWDLVCIQRADCGGC